MACICAATAHLHPGALISACIASRDGASTDGRFESTGEQNAVDRFAQIVVHAGLLTGTLLFLPNVRRQSDDAGLLVRRPPLRIRLVASMRSSSGMRMSIRITS